MTRRAPLDAWMLLVIVALAGLGLVMVYSASAVVAHDQFGDHAYYFKRQIAWLMVGLWVMTVASWSTPQLLDKITGPLLVVSLLLLVAVYLPGIGRAAGGARRWIGFKGFVFQPSELARIAFVLYLARRCYRLGAKVEEFSSGVLPTLVMAGMFMGLMMRQPDFGSTAFLGLLTLMMLYAAGARVSHLAALAGGGAVLAVMAVMQSGYRYRRMLAFLDPWHTAKTSGFQIVQSFLAFGSGGVLGAGLSESRQKFLYLPAPHTDFIFSIIGEELGWIGTLGVLAAFGFIVYRGWWIAKQAQDGRSRYVAFGLTSLIGIQVVMNMGVATGLFPTKGTTLPFMSYGGSALVCQCLVVGLLLSISRQRGGQAAVRATEPLARETASRTYPSHRPSHAHAMRVYS